MTRGWDVVRGWGPAEWFCSRNREHGKKSVPQSPHLTMLFRAPLHHLYQSINRDTVSIIPMRTLKTREGTTTGSQWVTQQLGLELGQEEGQGGGSTTWHKALSGSITSRPSGQGHVVGAPEQNRPFHSVPLGPWSRGLKSCSCLQPET